MAAVVQDPSMDGTPGDRSVPRAMSMGYASSVGYASSMGSSVNWAAKSSMPGSVKPYMGLRATSSAETYGNPSRFGVTTQWDTFCATRDPSQPSGSYMTNTTSQAPPPNAPIADRLEFLHGQLDSLGPNDIILNRFQLLGYSHRRQGGAVPSYYA